MAAISQITIRRARRDDVGVIVAMLADDPLGGSARTARRSAAAVLFPGVRGGSTATPNIQLVVAGGWRGRRRRLPAALHPAGTELAGRLARPDRGRPRRHALPQPRHRRADGAMGRRGSARQGLQAGRIADASHRASTRSDSTSGWDFSAQPCRDDVAILIQPSSVHRGGACGHCRTRCSPFVPVNRAINYRPSVIFLPRVSRYASVSACGSGQLGDCR